MKKFTAAQKARMTPFPGFDYRMCKLPRVGELVATKFGLGRIVEVGRYGRTLVIDTAVHGRETVERADNGWWTIRMDALPEAAVVAAGRQFPTWTVAA